MKFSQNDGNTFFLVMCNYLHVLRKCKHTVAVQLKWQGSGIPNYFRKASLINNNGTQRRFNCTQIGNDDF